MTEAPAPAAPAAPATPDTPAVPAPDPLDIQNAPPTNIEAGQAYSFLPHVTDAAGATLSFSIDNKPAWANFNTANGALTGTPAAADVGESRDITITVTATGRTGSIGPFRITVRAKPAAPKPQEPAPVPNSAPTLQGTPPTTARVATLYTFQPAAADADGDALTFTIVNRPSWATFDTRTGRLSGTPAANNVRVYANIAISVSDGKTQSVLAAFSIDVKAAPAAPPASGSATNSPPTIGGSPSTTSTAGTAYSFLPSANDSNKDALTFSIQKKPSWASFSISTGQLSGTPTAADVAAYSGIVISVTDGKATAVLPAFTIQVQAAPAPPPAPNSLPVIGGTPLASILTGGRYSFIPTATDADHDGLTFSISNKPAWASFNTATGELSGTPAAGQIGIYLGIVISVSDGKASRALAAFSLTVLASAGGAAAATWMPPTQYTDGSTVADLAGYRLYYGRSASALDQSVQVANPGTTAHVITNLAAGTWYFAITAYTAAGVESALSNIETKTIL